MNVRHRYPKVLIVSCLSFGSSTHQTFSLHAFVSNDMCPGELGKESTGGDDISSFNAFIALNLFSLSVPILIRSCFQIFPLHGQCWNKLHRSWKDQSSVMFGGSWSPPIASVVPTNSVLSLSDSMP